MQLLQDALKKKNTLLLWEMKPKSKHMTLQKLRIHTHNPTIFFKVLLQLLNKTLKKLLNTY